jgi:hypothetical protein
MLKFKLVALAALLSFGFLGASMQSSNAGQGYCQLGHYEVYPPGATVCRNGANLQCQCSGAPYNYCDFTYIGRC